MDWITAAVRLRVVLLVLAAGAFGCAARTAPQLAPPPASSAPAIAAIGDLKAFEETLGGQETGNFLRLSPRASADERCYFTGKLQLPEFYSGLRLSREDESRCAARADEYDVFFYSVEAVASGDEEITVGLTDAPLQRVLMVVPHEDFHNQPEVSKAPVEAAESAATLVGFLTASAFARQRFGEASVEARQLDRDEDLFLQKSLIVNQYYDQLSQLYAALRSGSVSEQTALERKTELFADLQRSCAAISPDPVSFNKCPAAMNNAGLAFDRTYTRNYPMMHDLYGLFGKDLSAFVPALKRILANWPASATRASDLVPAQ